ncbi:cupin domain-containing protein [Croceimicrobium hydrocarbonivorans]|uniref:Cupin domain-containing protein n=1 Tax=Croceimicrobium hydrocarbonivorans TaxID=2761580 RepID=A0A7H0VES8_9FLAO|nr:cupin domain-containing protein [Croceimicrobium hydrocarbonivorans]QNR24226.1 cupin domain-containing protein [Croceimicrobium hydrocarbonivorans]
MKFRYLFIFIAGLSFSACQNTVTSDSVEVESIFPKGQEGAAENFTGKAYHFGLVAPDTTYSTLAGNVYFEAGARSNWHRHPAGQILIITDGVGYHQIEGEPIQIMRKGDVVKCPPHVKHWHGASADTALQQLYIVPNIEKGIVEWLEPVSDSVYQSIK